MEWSRRGPNQPTVENNLPIGVSERKRQSHSYRILYAMRLGGCRLGRSARIEWANEVSPRTLTNAVYSTPDITGSRAVGVVSARANVRLWKGATAAA